MTAFQLPAIPQIQNPQFARDLAAELKKQAEGIRASEEAGYETIRYSVRRGGIAGFFGATRSVTERRLKPGAQQLLANASQLDQMARFYEGLATSMGKSEDALTAAEQEFLRIRAPQSEGGEQATRGDLSRTINPGRLQIMLGFDDRSANTGAAGTNSMGTLGGLRIPFGT